MKFISKKPGIMSGALVIEGTRIPVSRIIFLLSEGHTVESIHKLYSHVPVAKLRGAIHETIKMIDPSGYDQSSSKI